jgi:hypothetical protein
MKLTAIFIILSSMVACDCLNHSGQQRPKERFTCEEWHDIAKVGQHPALIGTICIDNITGYKYIMMHERGMSRLYESENNRTSNTGSKEE